MHRIGPIGIVACATDDFSFTNCSAGTQIMLIIFLNNCKGYSIIMNHFLPMTLYSEAAEDSIE